MFGNPSDKPNNPNNNPSPGLFTNNPSIGLFGTTPSNPENKSTTNSLFGNPSGGLFGTATPPSAGLFGSTPPPSGGLFASTNTNNGGLFASTNKGTEGLFGTLTNNMKTTQRKEGGLFDSLSIPKPSANDQTPKLVFPGLETKQAQNSFFGTSSGTTPQTKDQKPNTGSLFGANTGSFFATSNPNPTPTLFSGTPTTKQDDKKPTASGGLFSGNTLDKKQSPQNKQKPIPTFGQPSNSMFPNTSAPSFGDKKQTAGLFGSTSLLSGQHSSLFGGLNKKQDDRQSIQTSKTPNTPLFGQKNTPENAPQQKPAFSLTGGVGSSTPLGSSGIFGKKQPEYKIVDSQQSSVPQNLEKKKPSTPFNSSQPKEEMIRITASPSFGSGGLFGTQKLESKPSQTPSSLFNTDKKQNASLSTGGLFGSNNQQVKPKEATAPSGLLAGNTSLFSNKTPPSQGKDESQNLQVPSINQPASSHSQQNKAPQNLLATFSKQQIQDLSNSNQTISNTQKRTNRTISFNQSFNQPTENSPSNPNNQNNPSTTKNPLSGNQPNLSQDNKSTEKPAGITMTQSIIKPSTTTQNPTQPTSNLSKSKNMMQQSFFKPAQTINKQTPSPTIWTAFEISKLLKEQIIRKSHGLTSRIGQKSVKNQTKNIEQWIEQSFKRSNSLPTTENLQKYYSLHTNEDINRFLNDIAREVVLITNLQFDEKSFKLVNKLFFELLDRLGIKEYLFSCTKVHIPDNQSKNLPQNLQIVQLNINYFTKHQIYKFDPEGYHLNFDSEELQKYLLTLTKKFITNQLQYLQYVQNKIDLLKLPSQLFFSFLTYCLQYKKIRLTQSNFMRNKNPELIDLVRDFEKKIIRKITTLLSGFVQSTFYDYLLINKQNFPQFIQMVQEFSYNEEEDIIHLSLKVILNNLGIGTNNFSGKQEYQELQMSPQLLSLIKETKSLQLLPFRTLAAIVDNKGYRTSPSSHDLYRYINGPEWLEWLEIYLGNSSAQKQISVNEAKNIIKILKYPLATTKRMSREKLSPKEGRYMRNIESKVLNRKKPIYKYIISLKEENMLNIFYEILMSIIYDYESYRKIEELFFRQKDEFNYEFRNVIAEICNYPTQKFKQQIPFLQQKVLYFLRIVQVAPQRTLNLQKLVFEGAPQTLKRFSSKQQTIQVRDNQQVGHKICHLIIDTINYFGLKNDQKIVAKCISAVKSLLQNDETSLSMKIAMAVNKPQMLFISSSLLAPNQYRLIDSLVVDMTQLLQFMLISQEFSQTLALSLYTNNSEEVHLERMYSVRYSNKDYLPFARELIKNHSENKNLNQKLQQTPKLTITYSSYWILKCLEAFVQGLRQDRTTGSSYGKNLLYMLSLILEKFFIPISHDVEFQNMSTKMMEETIEKVNNPIYSNSSSNEIPKVLLYLAEALNTVDIMSILSENLKYKLLNTGKVIESNNMVRTVKYCLANDKLEDDYEQNQFIVYLSVRILKQILQVYRVYEQFKHAPLKPFAESLQSAENHFVYKLLTRFKWIQDIEFNLFLKGFSKTDLLEEQKNATTNLIIGLITLLMLNGRNQQKSNNFLDQIFESTPLNLKEHNYRKPFVVPIECTSTLSRKSSNQLSSFAQVQNFYTKFGQTLNFQAINNFLVNPTNAYLESYESLQCLVIQSLGLMVSGEALFGTRACNTINESSINIAKFIGFYNNLELSSEVFSNMWLLESFENQLYGFLVSENTSVQLKQAVLDFLYQVIKSEKSGNNFIIAKKIFYRYLVRHLDKFSVYSEDQVSRLNTIIIRILNVLQQKDYFMMRKNCSDRLLDALIGGMLRSSQKCLKSTGNLIKLIKSFNLKVYYASEFAYYHLQRTYEEREMVKTGQAFQILKGIIELVEKRFFDVQVQGQEIRHKWKCIRRINSLIIGLNLPFIAATIHDSNLSRLSIRHVHQEETNRYYFNTNIPHSFGPNPNELYLTQAKCLSFIQFAFDTYKQNIVDWLSFAAMRLGSRVLRFLNWALTVNNSLYGNQPVIVKSRQLLTSKQETIVCSMHMGTYRHTAVELFADTQNQAVNLVKTLFDQSFKNLEKGMTVNQAKSFSIMGYCLQWIRARQNKYEILIHLVKNIIRNPFWIDQNTIKNHSVIKFILSLVSIGSNSLESTDFKNIRATILQIIHKFKEGKSQFEQSLIQELISILISIPPQLQDTMGISQIVSIWKTQTNNEYFYNQSRLLLEFAQKNPNQIAKLKAIRSCQKIKKAVSTSHYSYNLRFPDSISFTWGLKIASTLMSTEMETVLIFQEISEFFNLKNDQIYNLLLTSTSTFTLVHIEELHSLLEFILTLITSQSWVTVHRKQFEKLTYALSHKLMNTFMDFINSKISFVAESDMEKRFKKVKFETIVNQINEQAENNFESSLDKNSVFRMMAEIKMIECIKTFTIVLSRCFEQSWYVHKYFNEEVYDNYRYGVSFWDRMNKCIMDLIRFNINIEKKWKKSQHLNEKLLLIQDCVNSSEFFVQTGYLSSLYWIPSSAKELFEQFEEVNRLFLELGTIHLIQEKTFRKKYQCLMKGNIQKFGKKLLQNSKLIQSNSEQQELKQNKTTKSNKTMFMQSWQKNMVYLIKTI